MIWAKAEGRRLKSAIGEAGTNQEKFAKATGIPIATLKRYVAGVSTPPEEKLAAMTAHLDVPMSRLLGGLEESPYEEVDVYDVDVAAGAGQEALGEEPVDAWPFPRDWIARHSAPGSRLAMVRVVGDSQYPDFRSGDRVVIDLADNNLRDGLAVVRRDGRLLLKRVAVDGNNVRLQSANPAYPDVVLPINEDGFAVVGMAAVAVKLL